MSLWYLHSMFRLTTFLPKLHDLLSLGKFVPCTHGVMRSMLDENDEANYLFDVS